MLEYVKVSAVGVSICFAGLQHGLAESIRTCVWIVKSSGLDGQNPEKSFFVLVQGIIMSCPKGCS